ncbi:MAG: hypothetical protein KatS3mg032_0391 [Cyclobacteriaceae bacterium]|nr:MAG: hypothetical protein KatS3mg032_0391 [Cyclobacteriaceae bacterium]
MAKEKPTSSQTKSTSKATPKSTAVNIDQLSEQVLKKLQALKIEQGLQADIQWCIGSYRFDKNPVGLYQMLERAHPVLRAVREKNPRSVAAKLLADIEKALKQRS